MVYAYLDDFIGCSATEQQALTAYAAFKDLMAQLGLQLAPDKCHPPSTLVTWLGYTIDTNKMELSVPRKKLAEVLELCTVWMNRSRVNRKSLQSFVGKILHIVPCIRHARKFTTRMLAVLRAMNNKNWTTIGADFKADVSWFRQYATQANGVSLFTPEVTYSVQIECDACLEGAGGNSNQHYYQWTFTKDFLDRYKVIHQIEAINIVVALRTLCPAGPPRGQGIIIFTDNMSSSIALTTGSTKDQVLGACARELWLKGALRDVDIKIAHKPGSLIPLADALSQATFDPAKRQFADQETTHRGLLQLPPVTKGYRFFTNDL